MNVKLAYGKSGIDLSFPDFMNIHVLEPRYPPPFSDPESALRCALRSPIGSLPLRSLVESTERAAIVVSDITRATAYPKILPILLEELAHLADEQILFFVATGTHRSNTDQELRAMLGEGIVGRFQIIQNNAVDEGSHVLVGKTRSGNPLRINREFLLCDLHILTGFIEPHFFAGFSGGGKAIMPGLAHLETIMNNHSVRNLDNAGATWGVTKGNPLWEEVQEAAEMVGRIFLVNVTQNRDQEITGVFAGDLKKTHSKGCSFARDTAMVPAEERFDLVVTSNSGYPLDLNLRRHESPRPFHGPFPAPASRPKSTPVMNSIPFSLLLIFERT